MNKKWPKKREFETPEEQSRINWPI